MEPIFVKTLSLLLLGGLRCASTIVLPLNTISGDYQATNRWTDESGYFLSSPLHETFRKIQGRQQEGAWDRTDIALNSGLTKDRIGIIVSQHLTLESGVKASSLDRVPALHLAFCVSERLSTEHLAPTYDEVPCCGMGAVLQQ